MFRNIIMANIIVPNSSEPEGILDTLVQSQCSPAKYWAFTLCNHTREDIELFRNIDSSKVPRLVYQEEIGKQGTPHLQGALMFKTKGRPFSLLPHRKTHWEKMYKKSTPKHLFDYACKKETRKPAGFVYCRGWDRPYEIYLDLYPWQKKISDELNEFPDDRTINWIWEPDGARGKTTFQKWVFSNYERVVVLSGKGADMKNGIIQYREINGVIPNIVLINVPRCNIDYLSYNGVEEIKDMFFYSGKYEGGMVCGHSPHVYIFANSEPDFTVMSKDRWRVAKIHMGYLSDQDRPHQTGELPVNWDL